MNRRFLSLDICLFRVGKKGDRLLGEIGLSQVKFKLKLKLKRVELLQLDQA